MGVVTCLGSGLEANWEALIAGQSGIGPITAFNTNGFETRIAGQVKNGFDPDGYVSPKEARRMDRYQHLATIAAIQAVNDSGLTYPPAEPYRCGVVIGSGMGGLESIEVQHDLFRTKGPRAGHPLTIPKAVINLAPGLLSIRFQFKGPCFGIANACTSGASAIGEAYHMIKEGRAHIMIAGGSEAVLTELSISCFNALRALSKRNDEPEKASRPFDLERDGFVMAEGAAIMILERYEHAVQRGASIHGEIVGYGATDDGYHMVMPEPEGTGAYYAMKYALEDAGVGPESIDYINAHGTSTELNDKMETAAIKRLFGKSAYKLSVSSTKSMTGHMIGAAGAAEAVYSVLAINKGMAPPTINLDNPDPECDLDYTPHTAVAKEIDLALSNSFAFGGQNASLVFRRTD
jgi:3-oxoacyl-[acyl-carrier-protein] synthase II